jgi:predicted Zn-dependent protease with MMP-like domain
MVARSVGVVTSYAKISPRMMTDAEFAQCVEEGIDALPQWVHQTIENLAFLIASEPTPEQRIENGLTEGEELFGLYEGVPLSERGDMAIELPDRITIFKDAILNTYTTPEEVRACVKNTIWHEVAHHFGHDEDWVREEELRRGKLI